MKLSKLASEIAESPTFALNEEARLLRERGEAVINLGIGEPKNKTPIAAILASAAKLTSGEVKYAPPDGLPSLKKAVIRYTEENYDRLVGPENVSITNGAKQSLFNIFYSILNPQDEVVVIAPYWVSYPEIIKMCMGIPVIVTPEDGTFIPRFEDIERAVTSATRAIIVNSPNNPSGAVYPPELIEKIVGLCEKKGIVMICDDIYHKLTFDKNVAVPAYRFTKKDIENSPIVVVNGVAKLYGMTGFRIGWVIAPRDLTRIMGNVIGQTTSCVSPISQSAAEGALNGLQSVIEALRLQLQNNRDVVVQEMRTFNGARLIEPQGTFYALPDVRAFNGNSVEVSKLLLKKAMVVVVPGREFGMEGHIRISFAGSVKDVTEGIARIKWVLDPTSPNEIYIGDKKKIRDWM
ncbi:MAG TPA: aminotransferase class I/II-fold pyridoxal phosphate-dependent enzyme [Anaerolineales bacterium]|nr:aminotransferase class I/II-fold pyridoxal phosphate-dependent enzyme [Anaerolineales bacterium]